MPAQMPALHLVQHTISGIRRSGRVLFSAALHGISQHDSIMNDLSNFHQPLTGLFASNPEVTLSEEQLESYRQNGFLSGIPMLNNTQVETLRADLGTFVRPEHEGTALWHEYHTNEAQDPDKVLFHALGAWRIATSFHDALWNASFTSAACQLLGGPVRFWHDQLFYKPALHGGVVAWHQDYSYWTRTRPVRHLTCWIGLDDANEENGCLHYIPGSHDWELLPMTGLATDMDAIYSVLSSEQKAAFEPVPVPLKRGEATFHHPHLVHGSFENRSEKPRRAMVINVFMDGVCSHSDEPLLAGVPVIPSGMPVCGQFFPLLRA